MASNQEDSRDKLYALVNYEDEYVQPLILAALKKKLPQETYELITSITQLPTPDSRLLQFVQYESIDFDHLMECTSTSMANAYIIRKALIRKHYLSTTVANWVTKYPDSVLKTHVKQSVEFEVDYAEFLDDALVEAWELKESWARNDAQEDAMEKEWWILKPGMSERGQGIRLFSSEEELTSIFEEWDPPSDDENEDDDARSDAARDEIQGDGIMTSQLRHFIAQPYISPPLLFPAPGESSTDPSTFRKFHIRTYVLATGALKVYISKPMLALFAARSYLPPWNAELSEDREESMKAHLTNTCLQDSNEREGSVGLFWSLPETIPTQPSNTSSSSSTTTNSPASTFPTNWKDSIFQQICNITGQTFDAAARSMSIHFQPLPNAFEIFGLDFMVSIEPEGLRTWLLEVNAFPDFRQSGDECKGVVEALFEGVAEVAVGGFFGVGGRDDGEKKSKREGDREMVKVLDIDLGRR